MCVCVSVRERRVCVCVCDRERERRFCVCLREREKERVCLHVRECVCVRVCVRERLSAITKLSWLLAHGYLTTTHTRFSTKREYEGSNPRPTTSTRR